MSTPKQTKITSFFQKIPTKKQKSDENQDETIVSIMDPPKEDPVEEKHEETDEVEKDSPPSFTNLKALLPQDWREALKDEFKKPYWSSLQNELDARSKKGEIIYPQIKDIFTAFHLTPVKNVRVVLFGQDPYHGPNQAHGLCFSVLPGVRIPPSLLNMYKELETDIDGFKRPDHGYLVSWAKQGVFMLNTVLTVREKDANSHANLGWIQFTDAVVNVLRNRKHIVWMLWGAPAKAKGHAVDRKNHCIIQSVHPSPLSASRGWFGSKPFSKCNDYLEKMGYEPIDWNIPPL